MSNRIRRIITAGRQGPSGVQGAQGVPGDNMLSAASIGTIDAVITAVGATNTPVLLDADLNISAAKVIPANLFFYPGGGKFVQAGGGSIEFEGPGMAGDPQHTLFSGFADGEVIWTAAYPEQFRPEWWGAAGDNVTDDYAAFTALLSSMRGGLGSTYWRGGKVQLTPGKKYYLGTTLQINRNIQLVGASFSSQVPNVELRFPANTQGIIWHGSSTQDGVASTVTGLDGEIRGVGITGAATAVNNTVLDTNGLTFSLTGGTYPAVSAIGYDSTKTGEVPAVPAGTTITLNGFTYITSIPEGDTAVSTATLPIRPPRMMVFGDGAGNFAPVLGTFPNNNDWAGMTVTEYDDKGRVYNTYTITSHTASNMVLASGTPSGVWEIQVSGLKAMAGQAARLNIYHGVDVRAAIRIEDCHIGNFCGDGVECHSNKEPTDVAGGEPNSNNSLFVRSLSHNNEGNGWKFYGVNSNNILTLLINAENNKGYGVFEAGSSGQNHEGWHNSFNVHGAFSMTGAIAANMVVSCYTEGQQPAAIASTRTVIVGGNHGAGVRDHDVLGSELVVKRFRTADNPDMAFYAGIGTPSNVAKTMFSFGAGDDGGNIAGGGSASSPVSPSYYLRYATWKAGMYEWAWVDNGIGTPTNVLMGFSGSQAPEGGGRLYFYEGFQTTGGKAAGYLPIDPKINRMIRGTFTVDPASIAANTVATQTFTLAGAVVGDNLVLNIPAAGLTAGLLVMQAWVSAADTVSITFYNTTGAPIDEASASWSYLIVR